MADFDVFVSYAHADRDRALALRDALVTHGLEVWLDDSRIEAFESITAAIERGLARSKALMALYSAAYPTRRACQWELTAAFVAAQRGGHDPRDRVLVVNPEPSAQHVEPVELRTSLFAAAPGRSDGHAELAGRLAVRIAQLDGELGELGVGERPAWLGRRPIATARFVGRLPDMWRLHSALTARRAQPLRGAASGDPAVLVTGMGGIGKSLLAVEYAQRFGAAYPGGVFWIRAHGHDARGDTLTELTRAADRDSQLAGFARQLGVATEGLAPDQLAAAIGADLDRRGKAFLWVVDDLPDGLSAGEREGWYAPSRLGSTLVTTRSRSHPGADAQLDLGVLEEAEGYELLCRHRLPRGAGEQEAARGLVGTLGGHALALDVAGAALGAARGVHDYQSYRAALAEPGGDELELAAALAGELPDGREASVARTLSRSIAQLDEPARDVLRLASQLASDAIPAELIVGVMAIVHELDDERARARADSGIEQAVAASLAERDGAVRRVHTLVARTAALLETRPWRTTALAEGAIDVLASQLEAAVGGAVAADALTLAHARHVAASLLDDRHAALLNAVAVHDRFRGDYRLALAEFERVLQACRRLFGDDHPESLGLMSNVALLRGDLGDHAGGIPLLDQVLAARRRVLGNEDPATLLALNNLGVARCQDGDFAGARPLLEQACSALGSVFGDEHPSTLGTMNNLAAALNALGDHEGARALLERTLAGRGRVLGEEHPDTLQSMGNLAETLRALGDHAGACALHEQALPAVRRTLGDEHPNTLAAMNDLGVALCDRGDGERARALHEQALASRREVLGDEHPATLLSLTNLAAAHGELGDHATARVLLERALPALRHTLGDEHRDTLRAARNLATALSALGDGASARAPKEQGRPARKPGLKRSERFLGLPPRRREGDVVGRRIDASVAAAPPARHERASAVNDVFLSCATADRERVLTLREALANRGVNVWLDESTAEADDPVSEAVEHHLARSKAMVAFYSRAYPASRACQWQLTTAFLSAQRLGDPRRRVLVINPEQSADHIEPVHLRDARFASGHDDVGAANAIAAHVAALGGALGDAGMSVRPRWYGHRPARSTRFVGRVVDMWNVHSALHGDDVALMSGASGDALVQVTGMGGIGKSALAEEYALRFASEYRGGVFWLSALGHDDATEPLTPQARAAERDAQLMAFARALGIVDAPRDQVTGALARALEADGQPFLWIVDDLPPDQSGRELDEWLAPSRLGKTLVTTRSRGQDAVGRQIELGMLDEVEGVELLSRHRSPRGEEDVAAARRLVCDLGGHPLALDVAGAALKRAGDDCSFAAHRAVLATTGLAPAGQLARGHDTSIAGTLARSISRLDEAALDFLRLASLLAVHPIPARLVVDVFARADHIDPSLAARRAVGAMHEAGSLSLASTTIDDDGSWEVHALVSRTMRLLEPNGERAAALASAATRALAEELRSHGSTELIAADAMVTHARHLASPASSEIQLALLDSVARQDWRRGDYGSARALYELLAARREASGEPLQALTAREGQAMALYALGDPTAARELLEPTVATRVRRFGETDYTALCAKNNLAMSLNASGDAGGARALLERVVEASRDLLGGDDRLTLAAMNNLAEVLHATGDVQAAKAMEEEVLHTQLRVLGAEHPDTLTSMHNLAETISGLGYATDARELHERALHARRRVLGDEHPLTLVSMCNLAVTLRRLRELESARDLLERAVEALARVLGDQHPDTRVAREHLALMRSDIDSTPRLWRRGRAPSRRRDV